MSKGKVGTAHIVGFTARLGTGAPATGISPGDFVPRVRCLDTGIDDGSVAAVVEIGNGRYSMVIRAAFSTGQGAGNYLWSAEANSAAPAVRDIESGVVEIHESAIDDVAQPGDQMDLVTDAVDAGAVATSGANTIRDASLSDSTPFAGANIDAAISSRSDFDEAANPVELLDSGGSAGTSAAELVTDVGAQLSSTHGGGSWLSAVGFATPGDAMTLTAGERTAVATAVWSTVLTGYSDEDLAGGMVNWGYRAIYHRQEVNFAEQRLEIYDKAGENVIGYWPLSGGDGGLVVKALGAPARRGVFV